MTACSRHHTRHDGRHPRVYFVPASRGLTRVLCTGCVEGLRALGMDWREERRSDPQRKWKSRDDRQGWKPVWRQAGIAKDLSGALR